MRIADRPPPVSLSLERDSETQMAFAVSGLESRSRRRQNGTAETSGNGVPPTWDSTRRHRAASLCSASTSGSIFCDGFDAVRRCSSGDFEDEEKREEEEEKRPSAEWQGSPESEESLGGNDNAANSSMALEEDLEEDLPLKSSVEKMLEQLYQPSWVPT